ENLRWGISAAGYLEPKIFKFFNSSSVALCSGFGMTEATGGISMTPPGEYVKDSVGIPLPGVQIRFSENGELEFSGHYAAKYFDPTINKNLNDTWIKTGDLFKQDENGFLYIVDRIKDIYKNIKGQTIAPSFIEKKFEKIPGLKRAFLVGDMKPYNTLLIAPDLNEPFIQQAESEHILKSYFGTLISSVNKTLNPYERIVKFIILSRDFEESKDELTPKGTFKRKIIEFNFKKTIDELYVKSNLKFGYRGINIIVPVWALKDLGITENDLVCSPTHLTNKENGTQLTIKKINKSNRIKIGDYEYVVKNNEIDLGVFILQPILWMGNKELIEFFICKEEWDADFQNISSQIFFNYQQKRILPVNELKNTDKLDTKTKELNTTILKLLNGNEKEILDSLKEIEKLLTHGEYRINNLLSRRTEALASHPKFSVRSEAYKILLFNKPDIDYNKYFPAFINSRLSFLNKKVIENIFKDNVEGFNLDAFRKRLEAYRTGLTWPADEPTKQQFKRVLELLISFAYKNPSTYGVVRVELISWILHTEDLVLSRYAQKLFNKLSAWFEQRFKSTSYERSTINWKEKIIYQENITDSERQRINKILSHTTFLKEAFMLIYDLPNFDLKEIKPNGIFISTIASSADKHLYRISINTKHFKHYELVILLKQDINRQEVLKTIYEMIKISHGADGTRILPKLGNFRSNLGIISFEFINDLTVWDRIRMINSTFSRTKKKDYEFELKLLFIRGMAAFFRVLKNSNYKIIPGNFSPLNAVVPESHFMEGSLVISISGWTEFKSYEEFLLRLYNNFYLQTYAHYPVSKDYINIEWIFDACFEALGREKSLSVLPILLKNMQNKKINQTNEIISQSLLPYINRISTSPYINSYIMSAIKNYEDWLEENPSPIKEATENFVNNLFSLYRFDKYPEIDRYIFYMRTYFSSSSEDVLKLFSRLISSLFKYPDESALSRIELVELQEVLTDETDKRVLNKLMFPYVSQDFALIAEKSSDDKEVILKTQVTDSFGINYTIRKPLSAFEIASLHKLFILDNYPVRIEPALQYLVIIDNEDEDRIVGGICYKIQYMNVAHLEGIDVSRPYRKRGLGEILIEAFCERLKSDGVKTLTTHFYLRPFFEKLGFKMDSRWGGLARMLY
ncbi:MAG TPA: GNAT family N-acetyltransferase, partial [Ignavibacteriaceae bacterium]|nr:GNAT family N-acetyltransferase [Ignavibacteriaceae bacterium]